MTNPLSELLEAQHLLGEIFNYLTEVEQAISKQSSFPVELLQKAKAFQALAAISEVVEHYDEARRRRKHWEPDEVAEQFIRHNLRFLIENDLSVADLADHLALPEEQITPIFDTDLLDKVDDA